MEILILSGKFGMGHWSAANALRERLAGAGRQVRLMDFFDYALPEAAPALYRGFDLLVTYGVGVYNLVHRMTRDTEGEGSRWLCGRLEALLEETRPDLVLSTHPVCSGAVSRLKEEGRRALPLVTCVTDITCHSEWIHPGTDCYLVPSATVRDGLAGKGVPPRRVVVTGVPVGDRFSRKPRRRPGRERSLLVMGGGLGLMPRGDGFYEALNALPHARTTILTGKNRKLFDRLAGKYPRIEAVPFTDRVSAYMGGADLMLSKPGGVTAFEAIAAGLPMLVWEPFLEQERENAKFLADHGMARIAPRGEGPCLAAIQQLLYDDGQLARMRRNMARMERSLRPRAVEPVVERLCAMGRGA